LEHGLCFCVHEGEVGGLGDFSFSVGDDDPGLLFDGRAPLGGVPGHGQPPSSRSSACATVGSLAP
jgi:hypothetical protein